MSKKVMPKNSSRKLKSACLVGCVLAFGAASIAPAYADPPPWAPAWGYHKKAHKKNKHKKGKQARYQVPPAVPFGIDRGACNRELLGSVLGAAAGGLAGSQVGKGSGKLAAVAGGAIIGYLIGGSIGRSMDEVDQNCIGQVLEHGQDGQEIIWNNPDNGDIYEVSPVRTFQQSNGKYCREYTAKSVIGGEAVTTYGTACRQEDGTWKITS